MLTEKQGYDNIQSQRGTRALRTKGDSIMKTWYTVNRGANTYEKTFKTYEEAEMMALALAVATGENWRVKMVVGWDR